MPALDRVVAAVVLGSLFGTLVIRAVLAWMEFRVQRRAADLTADLSRMLTRDPTETRR